MSIPEKDQATEKETSVNAIAKLAAEAFGWKKGFGKKPVSPGDVRRNCLDARKAKRESGWTAKTSFGVGFRKTAAWFHTN